MTNLEDVDGDLKQLAESFSTHVEDQLVRDAEITAQIEILTTKVDSLLENVRSLLNLWEQARGMVTLVKWVAAISAFLLSIHSYLKGR